MEAVEVQKWKFQGTEEITWEQSNTKLDKVHWKKLAKIHTWLTVYMETLIALTDCP